MRGGKNREEMYRAVLNSLNCKQELEGEDKGNALFSAFSARSVSKLVGLSLILLI